MLHYVLPWGWAISYKKQQIKEDYIVLMFSMWLFWVELGNTLYNLWWQSESTHPASTVKCTAGLNEFHQQFACGVALPRGSIGSMISSLPTSTPIPYLGRVLLLP